MADCSDFPTASTAKTFLLDATTEHERVTLEQDRTPPASDGKTKKTMWGIENDATLQREDIDQLAETQRENLESTFTAQFSYKRIGNISLYVGDSLPEVDKLNSYQYPDDSGDWYGPVQDQVFPITIPANPSGDNGWALVNAITTTSLGDLTNYQATSTSDMAALGIKSGSYVRIINRGNSLFRIDSSGVENGMDILDAGPGKVAILVQDTDQPVRVVSLGFSESNSALLNKQIWERATRIAENSSNKVLLPKGSFQCDEFVTNHTTRGFECFGSGDDSTIITFSGSGTDSLVITSADGVNANRATYRDFTVHGNRTKLKSCTTMNYSDFKFKSLGHVDCDFENNGIQNSIRGHYLGAFDGVTPAKTGLRLFNNANTVHPEAYVNGANQTSFPSYRTVDVTDGQTNLSSSVSSGVNIISVSPPHSFERYQNIIIQEGGVNDVVFVESVNGNELTLKTQVNNSYTPSAIVYRPNISNSILNSNIEVGQVRIENVTAFSMTGSYAEELRIQIEGNIKGCVISANSVAEALPTLLMQNLDPLSNITIDANFTAFQMELYVKDRDGVIGPNLDVKMFPSIEIKQNTRKQNNIIINSTYTCRYLECRKVYTGLPLNDIFGTKLNIEGVYNSVSTSAVTAMRFKLQGVNIASSDQITIDIRSNVRAAYGPTGVTPTCGILTHAGTYSAAGVGNYVSSQSEISRLWLGDGDIILAASEPSENATVIISGGPNGENWWYQDFEVFHMR